MNILALNAGSNSLKFEIVNFAEHNSRDDANYFGSTLVSGVYDDIGKDESSFALLDHKQDRDRQKVKVRDHGHATELLLQWIGDGNARGQGIADFGDIQRVGHRVVHGADLFHGPAEINEEVVRQIESLQDLAPLHNRSDLAVIRAAQQKMESTPMFAVFDTVFHQSLPDEAALYPLPVEISEKHRIRHYGFHGISHRYMLLRYAKIRGRQADEVNAITLHLEGGSSLAAIRRGKSVDTSMGFTPLEGLMMGTRCGDIDPAVVTYLMKKERLDADGVEQFLNKRCGLLGVSAKSADTRVLVKHISDPRVKLALQMYSYRVRKYIGAYLAALGGAEAIVVGGGIGENTPAVRESIFADMGWCGIVLDFKRNADVVDREDTITAPESKVPVWIVPTQEGKMLAREVADA